MYYLDQTSKAISDFDGLEGELSFKVCSYVLNTSRWLTSRINFGASLWLQTGDRIKIISRVNADWINGEIGGRKGMFPANFVDFVPDDLPMAKKEAAKSNKKVSTNIIPSPKIQHFFD